MEEATLNNDNIHSFTSLTTRFGIMLIVLLLASWKGAPCLFFVWCLLDAQPPRRVDVQLSVLLSVSVATLPNAWCSSLGKDFCMNLLGLAMFSQSWDF
ncbi:hypothetical protein GDO78_018868 [Eleutherodactylus coqui]|uniref:Uncharacterized protein n=1 Tax=Eleutherodactylus coqui TaxID=57060 RepID=A0A8J6E9A8_ELECQ|nr:hypothetical protein GDO78_018868 [Eleutherodactylus coqui]